jgi:diguanylate cyclase (GGDEF)-like protein
VEELPLAVDVRALAFDALGAQAAVLDAHGRIVATNRAWDLFEALNGGEPDGCGVGVNYLAVSRSAGAHEVADGLEGVLLGVSANFEWEYPCNSEWEDRWFLLQASALPEGGAVVIHVNITRRKHLEERLTYLAGHDHLTGLANRTTAMEHAERAVAVGDPVTVLFCDLDGFKAVNDELGHAGGDELLVQVANRLQRVVRAGDVLARLGGDEFVIVCGNCDRAEADLIAERVEAAFAEPFQLGARPVPISGAVGLAVSTPTSTVDDLFVRADAAMYRRKNAGQVGLAPVSSPLNGTG